jgi:NIMA (never in mitosis gene a)-related kinase
LKNLSHPNIVAYKGSLIDKGILVIIMEFCDVGDLSFHIKMRRAKNEFFTETEIMNWFVQLCLSLEYIHGKKILHRDIKSSNVFLTRNNTIKLGDFGISKVLENTNDQAITVQGTPYYMSPEVCQNTPYTYKSDIWALGCILYELCTLKHAFNAENLLGLVFKIVQDKQDPLPAHYSEDMKSLVSLLLNKNDKERPSAIDILKIPFVLSHMRNFVDSQGQITLKPTLSIRKEIQPEQVLQDNQLLQTKDMKSLTPAERMRLRKE